MYKNTEEFDEMKNLGICVKAYIKEGRYKECENLLAYAMYLHPHAPEPHNLFGILLEKEKDHLLAMKHFRAALNLDQTYTPARHNLDIFGSLFPATNDFAYDMEDCIVEEKRRTVRMSKV